VTVVTVHNGAQTDEDVGKGEGKGGDDDMSAADRMLAELGMGDSGLVRGMMALIDDNASPSQTHTQSTQATQASPAARGVPRLRSTPTTPSSPSAHAGAAKCHKCVENTHIIAGLQRELANMKQTVADLTFENVTLEGKVQRYKQLQKI
jgi:DNA-binding NtrC family response regulator